MTGIILLSSPGRFGPGACWISICFLFLPVVTTHFPVLLSTFYSIISFAVVNLGRILYLDIGIRNLDDSDCYYSVTNKPWWLRRLSLVGGQPAGIGVFRTGRVPVAYRLRKLATGPRSVGAPGGALKVQKGPQGHTRKASGNRHHFGDHT